MADDTRHAAVVESLKATASELQARPHEDMNQDWADRMADALAAAGLLAAPAPGVSHEMIVDGARLAYEAWVDDNGRTPEEWASYITRVPDAAVRWRKVVLAVANRLAAPAARLPAGAASQIATTVHNTLCDCMDNHTGITLRSRDGDLVRDAVAALLESWQGASPAAPRSHRARHDVYVRLSDEDVAKTRGPWDGVNVDLDENDQVVGVEVLAALEIAVDGRRVAAAPADDEAAVERVAKAIRAADLRAGASNVAYWTLDRLDEEWATHCGPEWQEKHRVQARAALAALREGQ